MSFFPPEPTRASVPEPELVDRWDPTSGNFPGHLGIPVSIDVEPLRTDRQAMTLDQFRAFPEGFKAELLTIARPGNTVDERGIQPDRAMGPGRLRIGLEFSDGRRGYLTRDVAPQGAFAIRYRRGGGSPFQDPATAQGARGSHIRDDGSRRRLGGPRSAGDEAGNPDLRVIEAISRVAPVWDE